MLSIIIPFFNAEIYVDTLINNIFKSYDYHRSKSNGNSDIEVIFVNNNSTDCTVLKINQLMSEKTIDYKIIDYSEKASSYGARNKGAEIAKGDNLLFMDADCIMNINWIDIYSNLKLVDKTIYTGEIILDVIDDKNIWELFDSEKHLNARKKINEHKIATAQMLISKRNFKELSGFEEVVSGGDYLFSLKAYDKGYDLVLDEELVMLHPTRKSYSEIEKKIVRIAFGQGQVNAKENRLLLSLRCKYFLKIFFAKDIFRILMLIYRKAGVSKTFKFYSYFVKMGVKQYISFINGYKLPTQNRSEV